MRFDTLEVKDKTGQTIVLRNAEESDAEDLIKYLRITFYLIFSYINCMKNY